MSEFLLQCRCLCFAAAIACAIGCGTTRSYTATEQLLLSDAVDATVSKIDFRPLAGRQVFLDTSYAKEANKGRNGPVDSALVNADYVISAVRQQLMAAGCELCESRDKCETVVEMRMGALGTDGHSIIYGIPAMNLGQTPSLISGVPLAPSIPELAIAKRESKSAASKLALFAYDRETLAPIWQSGIAQSGSNARDQWVLGIGPFQSGSVYPATRFAGRRMKDSGRPNEQLAAPVNPVNGVDHRGVYVYEPPPSSQSDGQPTARTASGPASIPPAER